MWPSRRKGLSHEMSNFFILFLLITSPKLRISKMVLYFAKSRLAHNRQSWVTNIINPYKHCRKGKLMTLQVLLNAIRLNLLHSLAHRCYLLGFLHSFNVLPLLNGSVILGSKLIVGPAQRQLRGVKIFRKIAGEITWPAPHTSRAWWLTRLQKRTKSVLSCDTVKIMLYIKVEK